MVGSYDCCISPRSERGARMAQQPEPAAAGAATAPILPGWQIIALWREQNPTGVLDLSGKDLKYQDFFKTDFSRVLLAGADLSHTNLVDANLSNVDLAGTVLAGAAMNNAKLVAANLAGATIALTNLRMA